MNKVEAAVERMANLCVHNRATCNQELGKKMEQIYRMVEINHNNSIEERRSLTKEITQLMVLVARLDQKLLNGYGEHKI